MIIETKYEIGQRLWVISRQPEIKRWDDSGNPIFGDYLWELSDTEDRISDINYSCGAVIYTLMRYNRNIPMKYEYILSEFGMRETYFTTRESAIAECERRNAELKLEGSES